MIKNWRTTIERADGTFYVRDESADGPTAAKRATLAAYRARYPGDRVDGFTFWVKRCVEINREVTT